MVTVACVLAVLFGVAMRKLRQRKQQIRLTRQLNEADQRNLGGIG